MPFKPPVSETVGYLLVAALTLLGAAARVMYSLLTGQSLTIVSAIARLVISVFASALVLMVAVRFQWQFTGTALACGIAAWSGITVVSVLESRLLARLSGKKHSEE